MSGLIFLAIIAALGTGLIGGIFFAFSYFIMAAFERLGPVEAAVAMRSINIVIVRSAFLPIFFGTALLSLAAIIYALTRWHEPASPYLTLAGVLYFALVFGLTLSRNVPLNNNLEAADAKDTTAWGKYNPPWTRWNTVRTIAALASSVAYILSAIELGR